MEHMLSASAKSAVPAGNINIRELIHNKHAAVNPIFYFSINEKCILL